MGAMRLLLIESEPGNATAIQTELVAGGHEVVSCADDAGGPCRGAADHGDCPMQHHVDLAIVAREAGSPRMLAEMGSVCATMHRVPLVEVDPSGVDDDLPSVAVAHALASRRVEAAYATAVRNELGDVPAIVDVRRESDRVHATVQVPASRAGTAAVSAIADRTRKALRDHDPFVSVIDVSVTTYPDPAG
jgi:hypothetical protein